jgi:hypothetical protein
MPGVSACRRPSASRRSAHPQQPDPLGDAAQQLDGVALDRRAPAGAPGEPGGAGGDAGLGGGQAAVGEQGEPVAVGDERDQGVQAGQQPAVGGWHGGPFGFGLRGGRSLPRRLAGQKGVRPSVDDVRPELARREPSPPRRG